MNYQEDNKILPRHALAYIYTFLISNIIYMLAIREQLLNTNLVFSTLTSITFLALIILSFFFMVSHLANNYSVTVVRTVLPAKLPQMGIVMLCLACFGPLCVAYLSEELVPQVEKWATALTGFIILLSIPYFFSVLKLLDSKYLINSLYKKIRHNLSALEQNPNNPKLRETTFSLIEALTNTAQMGGKKGDSALVRNILGNGYQLLHLLLKNYTDGKLQWREQHATDRSNTLWPEAFILKKLYRTLTALDDISCLGNFCNHKLELLKNYNSSFKESLSQLFMTSFNSYMNYALNKKNEDQFNIVSYYYCQALVEILHTPKCFASSANDLMHYSQQLVSKKMIDSFQVSLHDMTQMVVKIGKQNQSATTTFLRDNFFPMLRIATKGSKHLKNEAEKSIVKIYWEAKVRNLEKIHEFIINNYLIDQDSHLNTLKILHSTRTPLTRRFNTHEDLDAPLSKDAELLSMRFVKYANTQ